jgi:transcriptional regulator with XRE-family HTH domain
MTEEHPHDKPHSSLFGKLLTEKRSQAGLSREELAELARVPLRLVEELEIGAREAPGFDLCYRLGAAINSRRMQGFLIQDLWQAASMDRAVQSNRPSNTGRLRSDLLPGTKPQTV